LILPGAMLDAPRLGCLNIHASLLPRWRGAAPIQAAILHGDTRSGVSIMQMDEGLDTGAVLAESAVALDDHSTASGLHDMLSALGARMIVDVLAHPRTAVPQTDTGVTYAARLTRADGRIDWRRPARDIDRQIRGLTPWPGTWTTLGDLTLKIGAADVVEAPTGVAPGTVTDDRLTVTCGDGALRIGRLQKPGRGMMDAVDFLRGHPLPAGTVLGV
ncbi:methionyl-tRNA formyltransferase, partial [Ameyamaea chiangmaiensis]